MWVRMNKDYRKMKAGKTFKMDTVCANIIVNGLLDGDFEALGRIFTDFVNYTLYDDISIIKPECDDKCERIARDLLYKYSGKQLNGTV